MSCLRRYLIAMSRLFSPYLSHYDPSLYLYPFQKCSERIRTNHQPDVTPVRPRTQHDYHHDTKVKPEAATAVIELLVMGGRTPVTCWAVNKRQDNKLENCCIWLVIYLLWKSFVEFEVWGRFFKARNVSWDMRVWSIQVYLFVYLQFQKFYITVQMFECFWTQYKYLI
jgi:hypothetical protein